LLLKAFTVIPRKVAPACGQAGRTWLQATARMGFKALIKKRAILKPYAHSPWIGLWASMGETPAALAVKGLQVFGCYMYSY
jgi:hypothetical protein